MLEISGITTLVLNINGEKKGGKCKTIGHTITYTAK